ncbi:MAG TPA: HU family DNA-binding protein, partial [Armatimonadota bacterium]
MAKESNVTKATLVKMLVEKGFSVRKATKGVNAVFAVMAKKLRYGEIVPLPGGFATLVSRTPRRELHRFRDIHTKKARYRIINYNKNKKAIKFTPTLELEFEPGREKRARLAPRPEPPTLKEIRQLASEL